MTDARTWLPVEAKLKLGAALRTLRDAIASAAQRDDRIYRRNVHDLTRRGYLCRPCIPEKAQHGTAALRSEMISAERVRVQKLCAGIS